MSCGQRTAVRREASLNDNQFGLGSDRRDWLGRGAKRTDVQARSRARARFDRLLAALSPPYFAQLILPAAFSAPSPALFLSLSSPTARPYVVRYELALMKLSAPFVIILSAALGVVEASSHDGFSGRIARHHNVNVARNDDSLVRRASVGKRCKVRSSTVSCLLFPRGSGFLQFGSGLTLQISLLRLRPLPPSPAPALPRHPRLRTRTRRPPRRRLSRLR